MIALDYGILIGIMIWLLVIGGLFSRQIKNSSDMFSAGGQSSWWVTGLSGFMTIFSAGTFVVWGGIAYNSGLVVVSLLMVTGLSAVLVGCSVAKRWRRMGIKVPTEYLRIRFNESVVQFYTWVGFIFRGLGLAVALFALAKMLSALVPLEEGALFRDAVTGNLSVSWSIAIWGGIVIIYTMAGGLWAVMMTDVIQCIILCLMVLVVVPLSLSEIGGLGNLWNQAPAGFFKPTSKEFSIYFLVLWFWLGFFRYGADWAFVQRFISVANERDAQKTAYLMGGLYVISPILWMLPAMAYRILDPNADKEQAYVLMCQRVLPAGMLGIMMAAMFSATASMVSSVLNVCAGVFACDFYRPVIHPKASERELVWVGRVVTLLYGVLIIAVAWLVPFLGGAKNIVMPLVTLLLGPMYLPVLWGLWSKRINSKAVWMNMILCMLAAIAIRLPPKSQWVMDQLASTHFEKFYQWVTENHRLVDALLGLVLPAIVLLFAEVVASRKPIDAGWLRMQDKFEQYEEEKVLVAKSKLPAMIVASTLGMLGLTMLAIRIVASSHKLFTPDQKVVVTIFSAMLLVTGAGIFAYANRKQVT